MAAEDVKLTAEVARDEDPKVSAVNQVLGSGQMSVNEVLARRRSEGIGALTDLRVRRKTQHWRRVQHSLQPRQSISRRPGAVPA